MDEPREVAGYRGLANLLTHGMVGRSRPAIKTYLVERKNPLAPGAEVDFLRATLRRASPRRRVEVRALAEQPTIYRAGIGRTLDLWIDTGDPLFWEVHSLGDTATVATLMERWIARTSDLDLPWYPEELLRAAAETGHFIGFGLRFSRQFFADSPDAADELAVRVSGTNARAALADLQERDSFVRSSTLSAIRVRDPLSGPGAMHAHRVASSLNYRGRVSTRGDSFERHRAFVQHCARLYRETERAVRDQLTVGEFGADGEGLRGPVVLDLASPVDDVADFCARVFSGAEPFRLWALLERLGGEFVVAHAYDPDSGVAFIVEATPGTWRLFLPSGRSGAIALRLLALLQAHHDRRASMPALAALHSSSSPHRGN